MRTKREMTARVVIPAVIGGVLIAIGLMAVTALSLLVAYILAFGLITFLTYGYDKFRAVRHGRRVPEPALQLLSVLGGALGGWAGMLVWRHKTQHTSFWIAQIVGTAVIVAALLLL